MTSEGEYDEAEDGPYVYHRLVGRHWLDPDNPSQCVRVADVLGQRPNPQGAAGPHRAGERREGPTTSWWRTMLDAAVEAPGRHRVAGDG